MESSKISLKIVTPEKIYGIFDVDSILIQTDQGQVNILPYFANYIANVEISEMVLYIDGKKNCYAVGGGALSVINHKAKLMVNTIEGIDEIDASRIIEEKKIAEQRVKDAQSSDELKRAELKLKRALNREALIKKYYRN